MIEAVMAAIELALWEAGLVCIVASVLGLLFAGVLFELLKILKGG